MTKKKTQQEHRETLRDLIISNTKDGLLTIFTVEGLMVTNMDNFLKQPVEGMLYDLNRDEVTITTFLDDPKWINDFASTAVIRKLCSLLAETDPRFSHWKE